uniref:(California timema) hypothetical protein n=1 Tax=Timema californicum TaxID=61474 RepID=A0A7R9IY89_TIMCA|nr:unnamed protein product [Timema californicum]
MYNNILKSYVDPSKKIPDKHGKTSSEILKKEASNEVNIAIGDVITEPNFTPEDSLENFHSEIQNGIQGSQSIDYSEALQYSQDYLPQLSVTEDRNSSSIYHLESMEENVQSNLMDTINFIKNEIQTEDVDMPEFRQEQIHKWFVKTITKSPFKSSKKLGSIPTNILFPLERPSKISVGEPLNNKLEQSTGPLGPKKRFRKTGSPRPRSEKFGHETKGSLKEPPVHSTENTITVKFLKSGGRVLFTRSFQMNSNINDIKQQLSEKIRLSPETIMLFWKGDPLPDNIYLFNLGVKPLDTIDITFEAKVEGGDLHEDISTHGFMAVRILEGGEGNVREGEERIVKELIVEVVDSRTKKPFLGGLCNKGTGVEYHHACSQTQPYTPRVPPQNQSHRVTQTVQYRTKEQNTPSNRATQMYKDDHFIPCQNDRIVVPRKYVDAEEVERRENELKTKHAIVIQKHLRGWMARRLLSEMRERLAKAIEWEEEQLKMEREEQEWLVKRDLIGMTYPRTKADFEMLYSLVQRWREYEVDRIKADTCGPSKKAMLCLLLEKEIRLLSTIERHRNRVNQENKKKLETKLLEKTTEPVVWTGYKDARVTMETVHMRRATDLKALYECICRDDVTVDERIELLVNLKYSVKNYSSGLVMELLHLVERECDFLVRGLGQADLEGLRKRIARLFLDLIHDPRINPEMELKRSKIQGVRAVRHKTVQCGRCRAFKHYARFALHARTSKVSICSQCHWEEMMARSRIDLGPYRLIARYIRQSERKRGCYSSIAFIMRYYDFYYLVQKIWQSRSAINECLELKRLRLCRWDSTQDWSPWNCILLEDVEAKAHLQVKSLEDTYDDMFRAKVEQKHFVAKLYFSQLGKNDQYLTESGEWYQVETRVPYVPPSPTADGF